MRTQLQLEEALSKIDFLEKRLSECHERESKLLRMINTTESQIFLCTKNSEGEYTPLFSGGKIAQKYNFKTEQVKGKTIQEIMGDELFALLKPYYERAFTGEIVECRGYLFENRYFSLILAPLTKNQSEEVTEVVGIKHDITDSYKLEIENRKSTDVLNRIIESNPYSIQILNAEGYHIRENKAFLELFKSAPDENWSVFKDPQIQESGLGLLLQRVLEGELVKTPPIWYNAHFIDPKYPDNLICIGSVIFPVFLSNNKLEFIVMMHEDITERMLAKEALRASEERLKHLLYSNPAVIYTTNVVPPYDRTFISENVSNLTGYIAEDLLNNQNLWSSLVHPDDRQKVIDELPLVVEKGSLIMEYRFRNKTGNEIWIQDETKLIYDSKSNPQEIIGYWIDITKRKQADQKMIEAMKQAEESDRLKSAFLANMSHEVRTPLNSIIGFSELLSDPAFDGESKNEFVHHIITSGNILLGVISDIMDISKIDSGELKIHKSQINVPEFVSSIEKQFTFLIQRKNLELKLIRPEDEEETIIVADVNRLRQMLNNLINNAIKFTINGSIEFGYQRKREMVEFYVRDTGIGIPAEFHNRIFQRFSQVDDGNTRQYGGNGIGLAITKKLVELMGGNIWFESEVDKGSVFYFNLPMNHCQ